MESILRVVMAVNFIILIPWYMKGLYFFSAKISEMIKMLVKNLIKTMGKFNFRTEKQALYSNGQNFIGGVIKAKDLKNRSD